MKNNDETPSYFLSGYLTFSKACDEVSFIYFVNFPQRKRKNLADSKSDS